MTLFPTDILGDNSIVYYFPFYDDFKCYATGSTLNMNGDITITEIQGRRGAFNNSSSFLYLRLPGGLNFKSVTAWIYMETKNPGAIVDVYFLNFAFGINQTSSLYWYVGYRGGNYGISTKVDRAVGKWTFVAVTYINPHTVFFMNGERIGWISNQLKIGYTTDDGLTLSIFRGITYDGTFYLHGGLSNVRIFNRYLTDDEIRYIYMTEVSKFKFLLKDKTTNVFFSYDIANNQLNEVTIPNPNNIQKDDILTLGASLIGDIPSTVLENKEFYIASFTNESKLLYSTVPYDQLIVQNNSVNLTGFNEIQNIQIEVQNTLAGNSKWVLSPDNGNNWYYFDGANWVLLKEGELTDDDINDIITYGNDVSLINNLDSSKWSLLYPDGLTSIKFAFVISYNDINSNYRVTNITITLSPKPYYQQVNDKVNIMQNYSTIQIEFTNTSGNFKINYVD